MLDSVFDIFTVRIKRNKQSITENKEKPKEGSDTKER